MNENTLKNCGAFVFIGILVMASVVPFFVGSSTSVDVLDTNEASDELSFPLYADGEQLGVEYAERRDVSRLTYTLNGFNARSVDIEGEEHYELSLDGESNSLNKGYPELPTVARSIIVPDYKMMDVNVDEAEYVEYDSVSIAPSKGSLSRSEHPDPSEVPYEFGDVYERDAWYPEDIAQLRDPYIIRDFRGQVVEFYPFQYNPVREVLRVYTDVHVEVFSVGRGGENVLSRSGPLETVSRDFARIYERRFLNYQETLDRLRYDPVEEEGDMLIISHDDFSSEMTDFVDHKNSIGVPTELVDLSEVGSTADDISDYIEDYYHDEDLTYVLLVGDDDHVPTHGLGWSNDASDPTYSYIEGDDSYPDIFVGRFSASEPSHVATQVERSIYFEQNPDMDGEWREKAMGLACDEGPGYQDMMDYEFMDYIRDRLLDSGDYTHVDQFYDSGYGELPGSPDPSHVSDGIEDGRHLINYVGHGLTDLIATSGFNTGHMEDLENEHLPFFITVACLTGEFDASSDPCFGEQWVRVTHNGEPTGGTAAFSSSISQAWAPPMAGQDEMNHLIAETYEDNIKTTTGGIAFNGCMFMNDEYGSQGERETDHWHLFGDPSLQFRGETVPEGDPPEVDVTNPTGGEELHAGDEVEITWETTEGDDPVESINLAYSTDAGESWNNIETDLPYTSSYQWTVPNEHSTECLVRVQAVDESGRIGQNVSADLFDILGVSPEPPHGLTVQHYGETVQVIFEDDVSEDKGYTTGESHAEASDWGIREHGSAVGDSSWDFGDDGFNKDDGDSMLSWLISPSIEIPENVDEEEGVTFTFQHWRDFGDDSQYDAGNVKISTQGVDGPFELITPEEGYDGEVPTTWDNPLGGEQAWGGNHDWETATFDLTDYIGEEIHVRWDAGVEAWDGLYGDGWRIDDLYMDALMIDEEGDDHNLVSWYASQDDPEDVSHYNIYRSEGQNGPWDTPIDSVEADGSDQYEYVDPEKGEADDIYWWYVVRAVGENGLEEDNEDSVQEPGGEPGPMTPSDPEPEDGAMDVSTEIELSVYVEHDEGESMDVEFYDASDHSSIGFEGGVASGERVEVTWSDLDHETMYEWYAVADDGEQSAQSSAWSFTTKEEVLGPSPPIDPEPEDGATGVSTDVELSVLVEHESEQRFESELIRDTPSGYRAPAQRERAEEILISWDWSYETYHTDIAVAISEETTVQIIVESDNEADDVENVLADANMDNVEFTVMGGDTPEAHWIRDYGPIPLIDEESGELSFVNAEYFRAGSRPNANEFPRNYADEIGIDHYDMEEDGDWFVIDGGHKFVEGSGVLYTTDDVYEQNSHLGGEAVVEQWAMDYLNLERFETVDGSYGLHHLDMQANILDETTVLVSEFVDPNVDTDAAALLDDTAEFFKNEVTGRSGESFDVERLPMYVDSGFGGNTYYTHANSLIVNDIVLVPTFGQGTDDDAISVYESVLPDHDIIGIDAAAVANLGGAIHCTTREIPKQNAPPSIDITDVHAVSEENVVIEADIITDADLSSAHVYYGSDFDKIEMEHVAGDIYEAELPSYPEGTELDFFIRVEDDFNAVSYNGDAWDPHTVEVEEELTMDVTFHDASDDSIIGTVEDVSHGERADTMWEDLELDTTYQWYVIADDGTETAQSETWSFITADGSELFAPTGLTVEVDREAGDLILHWDDVGAPEYNIYHSQDQYADFETWNDLDTTGDSSYTHQDTLGGENYYIVRATDGVDESENSSIAFCVERYFSDERPRHFVSIPMGFDYNGNEELRASDIVMSIEGDLESSDYISDVVIWDYLTRDYGERFYYDGYSEEWIDDFVIEPGESVGFTVEESFTWYINATDREYEIHYGDERPRHYTSIPYTLADVAENGELRASDLVMMIEGDLESSDYIFDIMRFDPESRGHDERYYYDGFAGEWVDDFVIEPGDGIIFGVKNEFTLEIELITEDKG